MKKRAAIFLLILLINTPLFLRFSRIEKGSEPGGNLSPSISLTSISFKSGNKIDKKHTCFGKNISPQLSWDNAPPGTKSYAILVTDYDVPIPSLQFTQVVHWLLVNIPGDRNRISENLANKKAFKNGMVQGQRELAGVSLGKFGYNGPCPKLGTHTYHLRFYALKKKLKLPPSASINRRWFFKQIRGNILGVGEMTWEYYQ